MSEPIRPPVGGVDPETHQVTPPVPGPYAPSEPVLSSATIVTVVTAILAAAVSFGLPLGDDQQAAVLGAIAVVAPVVLGLIARGRAWAPLTVRQTVQAEVVKALREYKASNPPANGGAW
jgi:hypothetical protein